LKELGHDNIVMLKEIVTSKGTSQYHPIFRINHLSCFAPNTEYNKGKGSIFMVFEYMDHDLTGLMDSPYAEHFTEVMFYLLATSILQFAFLSFQKGSNKVLYEAAVGGIVFLPQKQCVT